MAIEEDAKVYHWWQEPVVLIFLATIMTSGGIIVYGLKNSGLSPSEFMDKVSSAFQGNIKQSHELVASEMETVQAVDFIPASDIQKNKKILPKSKIDRTKINWVMYGMDDEKWASQTLGFNGTYIDTIGAVNGQQGGGAYVVSEAMVAASLNKKTIDGEVPTPLNITQIAREHGQGKETHDIDASPVIQGGLKISGLTSIPNPDGEKVLKQIKVALENYPAILVKLNFAATQYATQWSDHWVVVIGSTNEELNILDPAGLEKIIGGNSSYRLNWISGYKVVQE